MLRLLPFITLVLLCIQSCGQNQQPGHSEVFLPRTVHQDLDEAFSTARNAKNIRSLLVSHRGKIIGEEYFDHYASDSLDHVRSVTKSVMATLIGIALDKGIFPNLDASISSYINETPDDKRTITIGQLLTMNSGILWHEDEGVAEFNNWVSSGDHLNYVLRRPLRDTPGTQFSYNSGGIHLLSIILTRASGVSTLEFANQYLFGPLGIKNIRWERLSGGIYNGAAGLELKPRDLVKIGQLYLNEGIYNNTRVLSEEFVKRATSPQAKGLPAAISDNAGYGYCWFVDGSDGISGYAAMGFAGQLIAVVPDRDLVMVVTHRWRGVKGSVENQQSMASSTLIKLVAKAISKTEQ